MRLLDLYCGAGGAAVGYNRAGFTYIVGVDIVKRRNYPFHFVQGDALEFLAGHASHFGAVHASPPCQAFVSMASKGKHRDLLTPTLQALASYSGLWVVENVMTAPMPCTVVLCGSLLRPQGTPAQEVRLKFLIPSLPCRHKEQGRPIGVYGNGSSHYRRDFGTNFEYLNKAEASEAMGGLDWMTAKEICEAVPPSYTEYIGGYLREALA